MEAEVPPEQEQPYTLQPITITLAPNIQTSATLSQCTLQVANQAITIYHAVKEEWIALTVPYLRVNSVGTSQTDLFVFIGDEEEEGQEENELPVVAALRRGAPGNYFLNVGGFTLTLGLGELGRNVVKELNDLLVGYLGSGQEGNHFQNDEEMDEMISAQHIASNGHLLTPPHPYNGEDEELGSDEEEQGEGEGQVEIE